MHAAYDHVQMLPAEETAITKENVLPPHSHVTDRKTSHPLSPGQMVLQDNFKELQQLLEDEELHNAALVLLNDLKPPSTSQLLPTPATLEEWARFDTLPPPEGGSREVDASGAEAALNQEDFLHRHLVANLTFLALSLRAPAPPAEAAEAQSSGDEALKNRLLEKLFQLAGSILGFSELEPSRTAGKEQTAADSTSPLESRAAIHTTPLTATESSILVEVQSYASPGDKYQGMEFRAIDIRGLTGTINPFLLLRFLLLGIALTGFDHYFDGSSQREVLPFFGPTTWLLSLSPVRTPILFDAMTRMQKKSWRNKSLVSRVSQRFSPSKAGIPTWNTLDISAFPEGSHKLLLAILQRHLEVIASYVQQQVDALREAKVPVESSLSAAENMTRLHAFACLPDASSKSEFPCAFGHSQLYGKSSSQASQLVMTDEEMVKSQILQKNLETAFLTITGLGVNVWVARLFSDPRLGDDAHRALSPYGLTGLLKPPEKGGSNFAQGAQFVEKEIKSKYNSKTALRACLYALLLVPRYNPFTKASTSPLEFVKDVFADEEAPVFMSRRSKPLSVNDLVERAELSGYTYLWLFEFLAHGGSAADLTNKRGKAFKTQTWARFVHAHGKKLIRRIYKRWKVGLTKRARERRLRRARTLLLQDLPSDWQDTVTSVFRFTAHSAALQQVTQFNSLFRDEYARMVREKTYLTSEPAYSLQAESAVSRCESQIHNWSRYGFAPAVLEADEQNVSFKGKWESINLEAMPTPDVKEWWRRQHRIILDSLESYLEHERHLEGLADNIYTLVSDTMKRMDEGTSPDDTFFLARVDSGTRQTRAARIARRLKKTVGKIFREVPAPEHVVWLGVEFDTTRIMTLLKRLKDIAENITDAGVALLLDEAFLELIATTVHVKTGGVLRRPLWTKRNVSVLSIRSDYATLSSIERGVEFDNSQCADHCVSLWQVVLAFVYPTLVNPSMLSSYEREFARAGAQKMTESPDYINSFRYVFASDAALNFWEYTTPSKTRNALMGMKEGQSFLYANLMRIAGRFYQTALGLHSLGHGLQVQAPFMGQMVKDYVRKRRQARRKAIFSLLTLGLMFIYTLASALDIVKVLKDVGMAPVEECTWNAIIQEMACIKTVATKAVTTPVFAALSDVFLVGLYAGAGSTLMGSLAVMSVYHIIRSESRTVLRLEMALSQLFVKLWRRMSKFASKALSFIHKRKSIISTMMSRATAKAKKLDGATTTPQVQDTGLPLLDAVLDEQPQMGPLN